MAAQVDHDPGDIAQEGDGDGGNDERQQGLDHTQGDHVVSAPRAVAWGETRASAYRLARLYQYHCILRHVTYDVAKRPDSLFTHVLVRGLK